VRREEGERRVSGEHGEKGVSASGEQETPLAPSTHPGLHSPWSPFALLSIRPAFCSTPVLLVESRELVEQVKTRLSAKVGE
jgi:hypothetical protein